MLLGRVTDPFDDPDWLFELKYDGFRALAVLHDGACRLLSRNGNRFGFDALASGIAAHLLCQSAVLDGEIVRLDSAGRSNFADLFYRRGEPIFVAFDLLSVGGRDLRAQPLHARKRELRRLLPAQSATILYCDEVEHTGCDLFQLACEHDLEGIVAKWKYGRYTAGREETTWVKIRNANYSQWEGRNEMFQEPAAINGGWHLCAAAAELNTD
jgi:bifunctional non-homologous end joining protein LigD